MVLERLDQYGSERQNQVIVSVFSWNVVFSTDDEAMECRMLDEGDFFRI